MARVGWAGGGREAERGAGYGRLRLARAGYVHLRRGAARLARRSGLTSNQSLLPANVSCCHTKGASFRSAGERRQGGGEWRPTMTGFCTNYGPWNRGYGPQRGFPRQTPPHLSRLICTSWYELERAGQIRPNRVVCGKHYPNFTCLSYRCTGFLNVTVSLVISAVQFCMLLDACVAKMPRGRQSESDGRSRSTD